ncbi:hypothetical protein HK097_007663 [Rhizophlyctis rosea]|uniref:Uncharacterized protein n=1 Tax=Rhizophlyctis rosea TaxID=64517 RepID=A0AAD5SCU5_9FUNG|nr:hypothetical protein HK097_007663 [Rhizophlyctis rosea]
MSEWMNELSWQQFRNKHMDEQEAKMLELAATVERPPDTSDTDWEQIRSESTARLYREYLTKAIQETREATEHERLARQQRELHFDQFLPRPEDFDLLPGIPAAAEALSPAAQADRLLQQILQDPKPAASKIDLPFTAQKLEVAAYFGITPVSPSSIDQLQSSEPWLQELLVRHSHNVRNLAPLKQNLACSACPVLPSKLLDDIIGLRYVSLGKIHPDSHLLTNKDASLELALEGNQVTARDTTSSVPINRLDAWLAAWDIYKDVHKYIYPTRLADLEKYKREIRSLLASGFQWNLLENTYTHIRGLCGLVVS